MKTILITGGSGFIGSHLCKLFIEDGERVICVDNLLTGNRVNIEPLLKNPNFAFHESDVSEYIKVDEPVHYVLHFASPASPADYHRFPIETLKVGSLGTHNALGLARSKKAVFLLASTSEVYGDPLVHPQSEDYWGNVNPIGPRGVYDEAKRFAEAMALAYHRTHGLDVKIVRIFNTFGPQMRKNDGRAIPNFINQALNHNPITIFGSGEQTRSFGYISDLIEGVSRLIRSDYNQPVNIGNPKEMRLIDLARLIVELTESKSEIEYQELPEDDPKIRQPDISRAKKILSWEPKVSVRDGLTKTINYFRNQKTEHVS